MRRVKVVLPGEVVEAPGGALHGVAVARYGWRAQLLGASQVASMCAALVLEGISPGPLWPGEGRG